MKKNLLQGWRKSFLIGLIALIISTLGIQASDELVGITGRFSGSVIESGSGICPKHSEPILFGSHTICMDTYEVSPSPGCFYSITKSQIETESNISGDKCTAVSVPDVVPWRYVTYTQAKQLCARSNKRLPTTEEWYKVAIGQTDILACFKSSRNDVSLTGANKCITPTSVHDLVGNVWEWMDDVVTDGKYKERTLPTSGYVSLVDNEGVVISTAELGDSNFGKDYAWVNNEGVRGILRGGFYGSGVDDGGIFSQNISVALDYASAGVGFRCVRDLQ